MDPPLVSYVTLLALCNLFSIALQFAIQISLLTCICKLPTKLLLLLLLYYYYYYYYYYCCCSMLLLLVLLVLLR